MVKNRTVDYLNCHPFLTHFINSGYDINDEEKKEWEVHIKRIVYRIKKKFEFKYQAEKICHTLSDVSKMPFKSYNIPASKCNVGNQMKKIGKRKSLLPACVECYADGRNNYAYPSVIEATEKRFKSLKDKDWIPAMVKLIDHNVNVHSMTHFRWHDVGDIQGVWHLRNIIAVCVCTPNVQHWLPTLETQVLKDYLVYMKTLLREETDCNNIDIDNIKFDSIDNLNIRISTPIINAYPLTKIANDLGCTSSLVESSDRILAKNMEEFMENSICTSSLTENECADCRKCWDKKVPLVRYPFKKNGKMNGKIEPFDLYGGKEN